jgi:hypothetical protein
MTGMDWHRFVSCHLLYFYRSWAVDIFKVTDANRSYVSFPIVSISWKPFQSNWVDFAANDF